MRNDLSFSNRSKNLVDQHLLDRLLKEFPFLWAVEQDWEPSDQLFIRIRRLYRPEHRHNLVTMLDTKPYQTNAWLAYRNRCNWPKMIDVDLNEEEFGPSKKTIAESLDEGNYIEDSSEGGEFTNILVIMSHRSYHQVADEYGHATTITIFLDHERGGHIRQCLNMALTSEEITTGD